MDSESLDKIDKLWDSAERMGFIGHFLSIWLFLFHPRSFWDKYKKLTAKDKSYQFIAFAAVYAATIWLTSYDSPSVEELIKRIVVLIVMLSYYIGVVFLANFIVNRKVKLFRFAAVNSCYTSFLYGIPQLFAIKIYYEKEIPLFLALAVILPFIVELIIIVSSAYVWQRGRWKVIKAVVLSIVFLNVADVACMLAGWDKSDSFKENLVIKEREDFIRPITTIYDMPRYYFFGENDSIEGYVVTTYAGMGYSRFEEADNYNKSLKEEIDSLKAVAARCRYEINKDFFTDMFRVKKEVLALNERRVFKNSPFLNHADIGREEQQFNGKTLQSYDKDVCDAFWTVRSKDGDMLEKHKEAFSCNKIGYLWHPCQLVYDMNKYRMPYILSKYFGYKKN